MTYPEFSKELSKDDIIALYHNIYKSTIKNICDNNIWPWYEIRNFILLSYQLIHDKIIAEASKNNEEINRVISLNIFKKYVINHPKFLQFWQNLQSIANLLYTYLNLSVSFKEYPNSINYIHPESKEIHEINLYQIYRDTNSIMTQIIAPTIEYLSLIVINQDGTYIEGIRCQAEVTNHHIIFKDPGFNWMSNSELNLIPEKYHDKNKNIFIMTNNALNLLSIKVISVNLQINKEEFVHISQINSKLTNQTEYLKLLYKYLIQQIDLHDLIYQNDQIHPHSYVNFFNISNQWNESLYMITLKLASNSLIEYAHFINLCTKKTYLNETHIEFLIDDFMNKEDDMSRSQRLLMMHKNTAYCSRVGLVCPYRLTFLKIMKKNELSIPLELYNSYTLKEQLYIIENQLLSPLDRSGLNINIIIERIIRYLNKPIFDINLEMQLLALLCDNEINTEIYFDRYDHKDNYRKFKYNECKEVKVDNFDTYLKVIKIISNNPLIMNALCDETREKIIQTLQQI